VREELANRDRPVRVHGMAHGEREDIVHAGVEVEQAVLDRLEHGRGDDGL
jgi:hypothetical protein